MPTSAYSSSESAPDTSATPAALRCPKLAALKAHAKALKKWRKQERLRIFSAYCASFHALGFSF